MTPAEQLLKRLLDHEDVGFTELWLAPERYDWVIDGTLELTADEVALLLDLGAEPEMP